MKCKYYKQYKFLAITFFVVSILFALIFKSSSEKSYKKGYQKALDSVLVILTNQINNKDTTTVLNIIDSERDTIRFTLDAKCVK